MNTTQTRYMRQTVLVEIGATGQAKLGQAKIVCVGAGGLGSPALLYLAGAGIGTIGIVDGDAADLSNLQRQVLFTEKDVGRNKAEAAADRLRALNAEPQYRIHAENLNAANAERILRDYDLILDGTDNFPAKFLINDAAVKLGKPVVTASILGWQAQAAVFWAAKGPCYRCLYPAPPDHYVPNCAEAGILGAVAGMAGSLQAAEAVKLLLGLDGLLGKLWLYDAKTLQSRVLDVPKNPDCPACAHSEKIQLQDQAIVCAAPSIRADAARDLSGARFIDVRGLEEWRKGHIDGAIHIPLPDIQAADNFTPGETYIVYCQHGIRSRTAAQWLRQRGLSAYSLEGGFSGWK